MELVELSCKKCGAPLEGRDIRMDLGLARCGHCSTIFSLQGMPAQNAGSARSTVRPPVPMPKNVDVVDTGAGVQLSYRWYGPKYIGMIIFTLFWNGFMCAWHTISLTQGMPAMSLFGLLHTAIGIGVAYITAAGFVNRTTVFAEPGLLTIHHHPLPWPGNKSVLVDQIEQLYCKEKVSHSKNGTSVSYEVHAALHDGSQVKLLSGLDVADQALFIEQELERYLGIRDRPVGGELPR